MEAEVRMARRVEAFGRVRHGGVEDTFRPDHLSRGGQAGHAGI